MQYNDNYNFFNANDLLSHKIEYFDSDKNMKFNKSILIKNIKIPFEKKFKKINLSSFLYDSNKSINNDLYVYGNKKENVNNDDIVLAIKKQYPNLMLSQIDIDIDFTKGVVHLNSKENSFYYQSSSDLNLTICEPSNDDFIVKEPLKISKDDEEWEWKVFNLIKNDKNYNDSIFWDYLNISGGISDDNKVRLYDSSKKKSRYAEYYFLDDGNVRYSDKDSLSSSSSSKALANYDLVKEKKLNWPSNIGDVVNKDNKIYFAINKKIDDDSFMNYGVESWQKIGLLVFEINVEFI